ncbi:hypothetical protein Tco_0585572 [Tanacetum coccineum]
MDNPNITMEEYIRLEEEKARRHGQTFNWQTATFEKVKNYEDEDEYSINFKTEFLAIVFDNTLTAIPSEPTVCPPNENELDFKISLDESDDEDYTSSEDNEITHGENSIPFDPKQYYKDGYHTKVAEAKVHMAPLPVADQRNPWLSYQIEEYTKEIRRSYEQRLETIWSRPVNRVHVLDFEGLTAEMRQDLAVRLRMVYSGGVRRRMMWRKFILALGLHTEQEMAEARDFLGPAPSYVLIRDPVRRLCHKMIAYSISGRGQAPEKACGGEEEQGQAVRRALYWVFSYAFWAAQGPERQQAAAAGALEADKAGLAAEEACEEMSRALPPSSLESPPG